MTFSSLLGLPLEEALLRIEGDKPPVVCTQDPHGHAGGTLRVIRADRSALVVAAFHDQWPREPQNV